MTYSFFDKTLYGATLSISDLRYRQLDWRKCLDYMQEALPPEFNFLRIGAYWSHIQLSPDQYDWETLDAVIGEIEQRGRYGILLSVGMKAPRYPEYYIPTWALATPPPDCSEISRDTNLRSYVLEFITRTVERYRDRDVIKAWQVENEPMDCSGPSHWFIGADFVTEEAARIRRLDARPLVINCWCEDQRKSSYPCTWGDGDYAVRNALTIADVLGLDIYATVNGSQGGYQQRCQVLPTQYIKQAIDAGKKAIVAESQAEPWNSTLGPNDILWLMNQHIEQGFRTVLMWGLEWWYELVVKNHDDTIFRHINWEARRFSILSRVYPEWSTNFATNLVQHDGNLYLTVVGSENGIWLFSSPDDGQNWSVTRVPQDNWVTRSPIGITSHNGQLYLAVVGDKNQAWLLSSPNGGLGWNISQVLGNWETNYQMNLASLNKQLYLTVVGLSNNEALLLTSSDNGATFSPSQILGDWQTQQPIGITAHNGNIYMTIVGEQDNGIWLVKYSVADQTYFPTRVMVGATNWYTKFPVGITSHDGKLTLAVVGEQQSEIWFLGSSDDGQSWDVSSGIFDGWTTQHGIALTNFVNSSKQERLHVSLVGSSKGEIYMCTNDPRSVTQI